MKKLVVFTLILSIMAVALFSCTKAPEHFTGDWKFSKIKTVELSAELDEETLQAYYEEFSATDKASLESAVLAAYTERGLFAPCYVKFDKEYTYTYDPIMEREATWVLFQTGETEGFLSFFLEMDTYASNPDPEIYPSLVYVAENNTLLISIKYAAFMVTVELTR